MFIHKYFERQNRRRLLVGKVIHWELCKKLKFDHTNKWHRHNLESVLKNETHNFLLDFEIQTDHLISARWPDHIINKKERTCRIVDFAVPAEHRVKLKECEKRDDYLDLARELKKLGHESDNYTVIGRYIVIGALGTVTKGLVQGLEDWTGGDCLNYSIIEISQNTEKSPEDLRGLAVTQTPVENHHLTLMWKTVKK